MDLKSQGEVVRANQVANGCGAPAVRFCRGLQSTNGCSFNKLITSNENVFEGPSWCLAVISIIKASSKMKKKILQGK